MCISFLVALLSQCLRGEELLLPRRACKRLAKRDRATTHPLFPTTRHQPQRHTDLCELVFYGFAFFILRSEESHDSPADCGHASGDGGLRDLRFDVIHQVATRTHGTQNRSI